MKSVNFVALNVSWKEIPAAQRNGLIKHYMVEYRKRWSSIVKTETVSEDKLSIKLKNLDPGTYDVRVAGRTSVGTGPMTGWKSAEAKEGGGLTLSGLFNLSVFTVRFVDTLALLFSPLSGQICLLYDDARST